MLGYNKQELKSLTLVDIVHPEDFAKGKEQDEKLLSGELRSYVMKKRYITKGGTTFYAKITKSGVYDGKEQPEYLIAIIEDITEEHAATNELEKSLRQKELLIQEIHHRVKNNLAINSALLELQRHQVTDQQAKKVLDNSMMRIKSMALVHESYYQSELNSFVKFELYLHNFARYIQSTLNNPEKEITIAVNTPPFELNINLAIPLELLINELVINAYEHAFIGRKEGRIDIIIEKEGNVITAKIKDDGGASSSF